MTRTVTVAAIQMDANPAPTPDRLARAGQLVEGAAQAGAELVVLPEIFNTGYAYSPENHYRAEPMSGPTVTWLRETAARLNIHLAGSLMLLDQDEVYNALLLFAPDGRHWRYNKNFPWGWERAYFRPGHDITVAETDLGRLGMLICWDTAHPELWRRYAGRVDMMLISSCPPDVTNPTYHFPDGDRLTMADLGPLMAPLEDTASLVFDDMLRAQTAWLGVPAVNTVGTGHITTDIPAGLASMALMVPGAPRLAKYLPQADRLQMSCSMTPGTAVVDAEGQVLSQLSQADGEAFTLAEVSLPAETPTPEEPQPPSPMPWISYLSSDFLLPGLSVPLYRQGLRRAWGQNMAPVAASTRHWLAVVGLVGLAGLGLGLLAGLLGKGRGK